MFEVLKISKNQNQQNETNPVRTKSFSINNKTDLGKIQNWEISDRSSANRSGSKDLGGAQQARSRRSR
jgi:hypothetical protein